MKLRDLDKLISLVEKADICENTQRGILSNPKPFITLINSIKGKRIVIDDFQVLQPWTLVALAKLCLDNTDDKIFIVNNKSTPTARFAAALGLDDIVIEDKAHGKPEGGRTVKLRVVCEYDEIEPVADEISTLILSEKSQNIENEYFDIIEIKKTIRYVIIELLRNVIQHSYDRNGAIVLAQRMDRGSEYEEPVIQIAVADSGIGILDSLKQTHPEIQNTEMALERSIWPYYSGKFHEHQRGSAQNAGLGLFFVSEMAKLTAGRVLISSRDSSMFIQGDPEAAGNNRIELFQPGFSGTLVVFEMPKRGVADYDELIKKIIEIARARVVNRENKRWIRFDVPPDDALEFIINVASENTVKAEKFSNEEIVPRIKNGQILILNFSNMKICTQSFMHALLFDAVKTAHELKVPLYARGASVSVADGIRLLEMYSL
jgi:anti-sigma regulatory factor (Ser/Thr protein kinase)